MRASRQPSVSAAQASRAGCTPALRTERLVRWPLGMLVTPGRPVEWCGLA